MNKWLFQTGAPGDTKLMDCPGCHEEACHWIGGSTKDIECLNESCTYFKLPPECKKKPNTVATVEGILVSPDELKHKMIKKFVKKTIDDIILGLGDDNSSKVLNTPPGDESFTMMFWSLDGKPNKNNDVFEDIHFYNAPEGTKIEDYASTPDKIPEIKIKFDFFEHPLIWRSE